MIFWTNRTRSANRSTRSRGVIGMGSCTAASRTMRMPSIGFAACRCIRYTPPWPVRRASWPWPPRRTPGPTFAHSEGMGPVCLCRSVPGSCRRPIGKRATRPAGATAGMADAFRPLLAAGGGRSLKGAQDQACQAHDKPRIPPRSPFQVLPGYFVANCLYDNFGGVQNEWSPGSAISFRTQDG